MNSELLSKLRQSALSQIHVGNEFKKAGRSYNQNGSRYFTYVLLLENGGKNDKIYVGDTDNIYTRLMTHIEMSPSSAAWVKMHGPVKRVLEITHDAQPGAERERFLERELRSAQHPGSSDAVTMDDDTATRLLGALAVPGGGLGIVLQQEHRLVVAGGLEEIS